MKLVRHLSPSAKLKLVVTTGLATFGLAGIVSMGAHALVGSDFHAGRIIDDVVFYNKNSMGVQDIQNFLNSKMPNCDNWGTQSYGGTTRHDYSEARGIKFPLTCLKEYYENPTTHANNLTTVDGQQAAIPSGAQSAAQIIYNAAQQYNINPQVLLVLLQKEQGLVLDDWPWPIQYQGATGYGCPDNADCNANYYGFYNQVTDAAWQFRHYADNPNSFQYVIGSNFVLWNPNSSCGGSNVNIVNQATASLYNYTPYQPNQAALNNLYGSGDSCSSYGNRNFWRYFTDWFGSTTAGPFEWQPQHLLIMDEGKNVEMPTDYLHKGERLFVQLSGVNAGTEIWYRDGVNPIVLGTYGPYNRKSEYCDVLWLSISQTCNRAARTDEAQVNPGETFHFSFYIHAPNQGGEFREYFQPLLEGRAWMTNYTGFHIYVNSGDYYNWQWQYFDAYTDSTKTTRVDMNNLQRGQKVYLELKVINRSATTWTNSGQNPTRLGTQNPQDHNSFIYDPSWLATNRPAVLSEASVVPGQTGTFAFTIDVPNQIGEFREYVKPLIEFKGWMYDNPNHIYMHVTH
jgi:hypothetical protein